MKIIRLILSVTSLIILAFSMSACDFDESKHNFSGGELVDNERISAIKNEIPTETASKDGFESESKEIDFSILEAYPDSGEIIYWTKSGEVWHKYASCTHINDDTELFAGKVTDAVKAGKTHPCTRCFD